MKMENKKHMLIFIGIFALLLPACTKGLYPNGGCPKDLKYCPDGSTVVRIGTNCEFAPCPKLNSVESKNVTIQVANHTSTLSDYPDYLVDSIPREVSTKYIVEHRTALNGKTVTVTGTVISALLGEDACPTKSSMGKCAQPRIVLGESADPSRDVNYDLVVLVKEGDFEFNNSQGQKVRLKNVQVSASKDSVILQTSLVYIVT